MKTLYLLVLIAFVAGIFKQGTEGGELVYKYGMNVEKVKILDDELFDVKDDLQDALEEAAEEATVKTKVPVEVEKSETVEGTAEVPTVPEAPAVPAVQEVPEKAPVETTATETVTESTLTETVMENVKTQVTEEVVPAVQEKVETLRVEGMPEEMVQPEIATH